MKSINELINEATKGQPWMMADRLDDPTMKNTKTFQPRWEPQYAVLEWGDGTPTVCLIDDEEAKDYYNKKADELKSMKSGDSMPWQGASDSSLCVVVKL